MAGNDFFTSRQYYDFSDARTEPPKVQRKDSVEPDGRHKVEVTLTLDSEEVQQAVLIFISEVDGLHEIKSIDTLADKTNFLGGYIAALYAMNAVDEQQADQLADLLKLSAMQQGKVLGVTNWKEKR